MLRAEMKGWSVGFPTTLQQPCEVQETVRAAHSEIRFIKTQQGQRNVQNKCNTQSYSNVCKRAVVREWVGYHRFDKPSEASSVFSFMDYWVVWLYLLCCFVLFVKNDAEQTPRLI